MINWRKLWRAGWIPIALSLLSGTATAQSVLNFVSSGSSAISITNPTSFIADVKFTLYNSRDGSLVSSGVMNPVSRRIPARAQVVAIADEIFTRAQGASDSWIQVTSSVSGLTGLSLQGDSQNTLEASESITPLTLQTIPYIPGSSTVITVTNPADEKSLVTVTFFDSLGTEVSRETFELAAHVQKDMAGRGMFARVASVMPVLATALDNSNGSLIQIHGLGAKDESQRLVAPIFENSGARATALALSNSSLSPTSVRLTFFEDSGKPLHVSDVVLLGNSSTWINWQVLTRNMSPDVGEGWLMVESASPVSGLVVVSSPETRTAVPLQVASSDQMLMPRFFVGGDYTSTLTVVGNSEIESVVTITLSRADGTTFSQRNLVLPPLVRISWDLHDLVSVPENSSGFLTIRSTAGIYALELIGEGHGSASASINPQKLPLEFRQEPPILLPRIQNVTINTDAAGMRQLRIIAENIDSSATLFVSGQVVPLSPDLSGNGTYTASLPASVEPGSVAIRLRSSGIDSNVWQLTLFSAAAEYAQRNGAAYFQKVEVTDSGLDPTHTMMVPIRNARVEVIDRVTREVLAVSGTDENGEFVVPVPDRPGLAVQVLSRLRFMDTKVLDNALGNRPYVISQDVDALGTLEIHLVDRSRLSGAFNILDALQLANSTVGQADSQFVPPAVTVFWSEKNDAPTLTRMTGGLISTTFFNPVTGNAYVLGDRSTDSDEFDDSVILHEYAHMLAARFSRDDSPGGPHVRGDLLDPRLAWSEGWANFFSSAVRGTPIYLDSRGSSMGVRYDLEENVPSGDRPGYRSEASVQGLLWDLFDDTGDAGDSSQFAFSSIWRAFTDLRNDRFVYLPYFLERFLARNPSFSDGLRTMVILRNIDFQPGVRPSVVNPFPSAIAIGEFRTGQVDSLSSGRTNLANSSHFYAFSTTSAVDVTISLSVDSVGPANNPSANDLDIFLLDANGKRLAASNFSGNGQSELIPSFHLTPGTYYVEVRSYYTRADTNVTVFNSGGYRLQIR